MFSLRSCLYYLCLICQTMFGALRHRWSARQLLLLMLQNRHEGCSAQPSWLVDAFVGSAKVWNFQGWTKVQKNKRVIFLQRDIHILCEKYSCLNQQFVEKNAMFLIHQNRFLKMPISKTISRPGSSDTDSCYRCSGQNTHVKCHYWTTWEESIANCYTLHL